MPRRTTRFQTIVAFVRAHLVTPGVTVTESKMLRDAVSDEDREVDVVIEGEFDGEHVVTSIEVIEHKRPATIEWVEGIIAKHRHLPTTKLLLISQSGFSKNALTKIAKEGGWVEGIEPEFELQDGELRLKELFFDLIQVTPDGMTMSVVRPDGTTAWFKAAADHLVYDAEGNERGTAGRLAAEFLNLPSISNKMLVEAHGHPERENLSRFEVGIRSAAMPYFVRWEETSPAEFHQIIGIEVRGSISFSQAPLKFQPGKLGHRLFHAADAEILGKKVVFVATESKGEGRLSWSTVDKKPLPLPLPTGQDLSTRSFPELLAGEPIFVDASAIQRPLG